MTHDVGTPASVQIILGGVASVSRHPEILVEVDERSVVLVIVSPKSVADLMIGHSLWNIKSPIPSL